MMNEKGKDEGIRKKKRKQERRWGEKKKQQRGRAAGREQKCDVWNGLNSDSLSSLR